MRNTNQDSFSFHNFSECFSCQTNICYSVNEYPGQGQADRHFYVSLFLVRIIELTRVFEQLSFHIVLKDFSWRFHFRINLVKQNIA